MLPAAADDRADLCGAPGLLESLLNEGQLAIDAGEEAARRLRRTKRQPFQAKARSGEKYAPSPRRTNGR